MEEKALAGRPGYDICVRLAWLVGCSLIASGCGRLDFDQHGDGAGTVTDVSVGDVGGDGGPPAIAFLQGAAQVLGVVTSASITMPMAVTAGNLVLVAVSFDGAPRTVTVGDTQLSSYTMISTGVAAPLVVYLFYVMAGATGLDMVTVSIPTNPNSYLELQAWEFAGIVAFDDCAQANGTTLAVDGATTPALSAPTTNELVFGWGTFFVSGHAGTGFTQDTIDFNDPEEHRVSTVPGSYPATMTLDAGGSFWTIAGATFRGH